eukprot:CAMPEP_0181207240 /NCGR_PEP_ID=MMETSP1096-20121128/21478_1 /TAXON_ID=156174 ORGANISM="Chrysochromulina ericina, Strain CCMP281" /NCGR_SAMPLE_ID=MMETSP1096 /ASSEMBLY_ACC=CAM_ASM_000453 /LENGTH=112 /DNA_ID=CAMNT_0023298223 /DNA_START=116 /DNA_END=455 /DNA_ORIENTATION=-
MPTHPICLPRTHGTRSREFHNRTRSRGLTTRLMPARGTAITHMDGSTGGQAGREAETEYRHAEPSKDMSQHAVCCRSRGGRQNASSVVWESTAQPRHAVVDQLDEAAARARE